MGKHTVRSCDSCGAQERTSRDTHVPEGWATVSFSDHLLDGEHLDLCVGCVGSVYACDSIKRVIKRLTDQQSANGVTTSPT